MKVGIVGAGFVGATAAYAMVYAGAATDIVLVDVDPKLASAQAEDILHATPFASPARIWAADYPELAGAAVVVLACGVGQKAGETRLQLLERNVGVFRSVVPRVVQTAPDAILVVASNPVDLMTLVTARLAGVAPGRVIGSGTMLDTARFRALLGDHLGISSQSVHAYVLGEHGDTEVLVWSSAQVGSLPMGAFADQAGRSIDDDVRARIEEDVRHAAYRIVEGKQATWFGIGAGLARLASAIRDNERTVLTLSMPDGPLDAPDAVSYSLPRVVGGTGITDTLEPILSNEERRSLEHSAAVLREAARQLGY